MKVTHKDFLMELKKSPGRFLSMLFIVALGVAFFSGIRASEPSMRVTGDAYFDGADLMDVKAVHLELPGKTYRHLTRQIR